LGSRTQLHFVRPLLNENARLFGRQTIKTPILIAFWGIISEHKVGTMFCQAAIRVLKEDPNREFIKQLI
jgi:propionyl-CoA synthetase